jgi:hypothetical protein
MFRVLPGFPEIQAGAAASLCPPGPSYAVLLALRLFFPPEDVDPVVGLWFDGIPDLIVNSNTIAVA